MKNKLTNFREGAVAVAPSFGRDATYHVSAKWRKRAFAIILALMFLPIYAHAGATRIEMLSQGMSTITFDNLQTTNYSSIGNINTAIAGSWTWSYATNTLTLNNTVFRQNMVITIYGTGEVNVVVNGTVSNISNLRVYDMGLNLKKGTSATAVMTFVTSTSSNTGEFFVHGNFIIEGVELTVPGPSTGFGLSGIYGAVLHTAGNLDIRFGAKVTVTQAGMEGLVPSGYRLDGVRCGGQLTVYDAELNVTTTGNINNNTTFQNSAVIRSGGTVNFYNNATVTVTASLNDNQSGIIIGNSGNGTLNISNSTVTVTDQQYSVHAATVNISSGSTVIFNPRWSSVTTGTGSAALGSNTTVNIGTGTSGNFNTVDFNETVYGSVSFHGNLIVGSTYSSGHVVNLGSLGSTQSGGGTLTVHRGTVNVSKAVRNRITVWGGSVTAAENSAYPATFTANNWGGSLVIAGVNHPAQEPRPVITTGSLPDGTLGVEYSQSLSASLGANTSVTYSCTSGTLPTGLSLSSDGIISGTPAETGTFDFTIRVAGNSYGNSTKDFSVAVNPPPLTFTHDATYDIPASTVGTAIENIDVSGGVSGGITPYTFSATELPAGIVIDSETGVINGAPATAGDAGTATVTAADNANQTASITIAYGVISNPVYTVTFESAGGAAVPPQTVSHGSSAAAPDPAPEKEGYNLTGWFTDNETFSNEWIFETDVVTQDTTLWAKWNIKSFTVTFAGEAVSIPSQTIDYRHFIEKPADPERENYTFGGWFTDIGTFLNEWNFDTYAVTQDTTLWAKWTTITGIPEIENSDVKIYPNPVKDGLRIESGELRINRVKIVDLSGKTIYRFNSSSNEINVSALSSGIYFLKLETDKGIITQKFVKE